MATIMASKATEPNLTFFQISVFSTKVLRKCIVTNFLFVKKIFLSVPYIHYRLMKRHFAIRLVRSLSSWW